MTSDRSGADGGDPALENGSDHGLSEAIYLRKPDGNGVKIYVDRPWEAWPMESWDGLSMTTCRLDLDVLLAEPD